MRSALVATVSPCSRDRQFYPVRLADPTRPVIGVPRADTVRAQALLQTRCRRDPSTEQSTPSPAGCSARQRGGRRCSAADPPRRRSNSDPAQPRKLSSQEPAVRASVIGADPTRHRDTRLDRKAAHSDDIEPGLSSGPSAWAAGIDDAAAGRTRSTCAFTVSSTNLAGEATGSVLPRTRPRSPRARRRPTIEDRPERQRSPRSRLDVDVAGGTSDWRVVSSGGPRSQPFARRRRRQASRRDRTGRRCCPLRRRGADPSTSPLPFASAGSRAPGDEG